jgi:hypothetical protein
MANSTGLIFRISNYDIVAENGRNFAFASQEVVERTGACASTSAGAGKLRPRSTAKVRRDQPHRQPEIHRVATSLRASSTPMRTARSTRFTPGVTFGPTGKEVRSPLHSALKFIGLTRYDESRRLPAA